MGTPHEWMDMLARYFRVVTLTHEDFLAFDTHLATFFKRATKTRGQVFRVSQYKSYTFSETHRSEVDCKVLTSDRMSTKFAILKPGAKPNLSAPPQHVEAIPVKAAKLADLKKRLLRYSICQPIHRHTWPPYSRARKRKMYLWIAM